MRVFIAIDLNEEIKKALSDLERKLAASVDIKKNDVKWVSPGDIHLTLNFLGEIRDAEAVTVCNAVKEVAGRHKGFELDIEKLGCFGGKSARVLWVGTGRGSDDLRLLQSDLEEQLELAGWPREEREFAGHLTLCRIRNPKAGLKLAQTSDNYRDLKLGTISADAVCVYQSDLKPAGPVYTVLGSYRLQ